MALNDIYKHPFSRHLICSTKETSPDSSDVLDLSQAAFRVGHEVSELVQVSSCWSFCQ